MRTFVRMRSVLAANKPLARRYQHDVFSRRPTILGD
jgi:hypothetical protein